MKTAWLILLCCTILISSCDTPEEYFKRPDIPPTLLNGDGTGFRNGELIENTTNYIAVDPDEYIELEEYIDDIELRLYTCLKSRRRCK
jgi:hypothetical protein